MAGVSFMPLLAGSAGIGLPVSLGTALSSAAIRSSWAMTTIAAIPAGSLVVVGVTAPIGAVGITITGVSDGTNTYTQAVTDVWEAGTGLVGDIWYKENAAAVGSGATLTATFSTSTSAQVSQLCAGYVTGILTASSLDKTNHSFTNGATSYASGSTGVLTQAKEIAFGFLGDFTASSNPTVTEGSGFTNLNNQFQGSGAFYNERLSYQIVSATTALNYQPSTSVNSFGKVLIATFKGA